MQIPSNVIHYIGMELYNSVVIQERIDFKLTSMTKHDNLPINPIV